MGACRRQQASIWKLFGSTTVVKCWLLAALRSSTSYGSCAVCKAGALHVWRHSVVLHTAVW